MRQLSKEEQQAIEKLALEIGSDAERKQLLEDVAVCTLTDAAPDGSILRFCIPGYERPEHPGRGQYRSTEGGEIEGTVRDADGTELEVMLLSDVNRRIFELELVKYTPGGVVRPRWETFRVR